jgi:molybdenum cofactor cytidylyltransferase
MHDVTSIAPIVLAAGDSTRMGYPKALLPLGTGTFLTRILATIREAGLPDSILILGGAAPIIQAKIRDWRADIWINPDPGRGQLSSIQIALSHLHSGFDAALIWPVDQPAVSAGLVINLARLFITSGALIALPSYGGRRGHPAIVRSPLFQEFMEIPLEEGPKNIFVRHRQATAVFATDELAAVQDIDTPADYYALTGETLDCALARTANS